MELHRIGTPVDTRKPGQRPERFELVLSDFLWVIDPRDYGCDHEPLDPARAFATSGEATQKVQHLERQYLDFAESITPASENSRQLQKLAYEMAGRARSLINKLVEARGGAMWLETEWSFEHELMLLPKNPRAAKQEA